jgi:hypothetical protein
VWLITQLPAGLDQWTNQPDPFETWQVAAAEQLRATASELLVPLEAALLARRRDGAEELEPLLRCHSTDGDLLAGTYALRLARDPDTGSGPYAPWLVLYAGHNPPAGFWATAAGAGLARFAYTDHPILLSPRPRGTNWWISIATSPFSPNSAPASALAPPPPIVSPGARHQWTATDPASLVGRATADLLALFPHLEPR